METTHVGMTFYIYQLQNIVSFVPKSHKSYRRNIRKTQVLYYCKLINFFLNLVNGKLSRDTNYNIIICFNPLANGYLY